jgi:Fusaric acid resistance protein-like
MYVAPRPLLADDPWFAVRLAMLCVICFAAVQWIRPVFPALVVSLPIGLLAAQRKRFDPLLAIGAGGAFIVSIWVMTLIVELTHAIPVLLLTFSFAIFTAAFYVIRRTGSPIGMLLLVAAAIMSVMGLKSPALLFYFRDGFTQAAILGTLVIPVLYWIIPPATTAPHIRLLAVAQDHHGAGSLIRASVLMLLCFWLYAVMPASDMILAFAAIYVLVFPTGKQAFAEAKERSLATIYGTVAALIILAGVTWIGHFAMLLGLVALAGLFFGRRMMDGSHSSMVYQYALSVTVALVASALSNQSPAYAAIMRILLTSSGAIAAAILVALLDALLLKDEGQPFTQPEPG